MVGEDIKAGTYKTAGPEGGFGCYWERAENSSGEFNAVIADNNLNGPGRVTLKAGSASRPIGARSGSGWGDWFLWRPSPRGEAGHRCWWCRLQPACFPTPTPERRLTRRLLLLRCPTPTH